MPLSLFDIRLLPETERGPDGQRLGRITIGTFIEQFPCWETDVAVEDFAVVWKRQLRLLVEGQTAVALVHDPRFAWIVYREKDQCFVQQRLALDGCFDPVPPRQTVNKDGERISEWTISLKAVADFVAA